MTDLLTALREALDIIGDRGLALLNVAPHLIEDEQYERVRALRSLADAPLTVLDALRDPEVRAGRAWAQMERHEHGAKVTYHRRWTIRDGRLLMQWSNTYYGKPPNWTFTNSENDHPTARPSLADLDAPCRLVPAEGDHAIDPDAALESP